MVLGPLYIHSGTTEPTLIGIVSFGNACAQRRSPAVFSKVDHVLPWIYETLFKYSNGSLGLTPETETPKVALADETSKERAKTTKEEEKMVDKLATETRKETDLEKSIIYF